MNVIGIDPSLISTGLVINGKVFNYCRESDAMNKSGYSKWFKLAEEKATFKFINYRSYKTYSEGELIKINDYDKITDMIISDILVNIEVGEKTYIGIEGYNFGASVGDLVDLVTFSTILRKKLWDQVSQNIIVFSPKTLKQESCKLTYPPINIGKKKPKLQFRNREGIAGGHFTKREMFLSIVENEDLVDDWGKHCKSVAADILENKTVKKPYEDINDAYLIYHILIKSILNSDRISDINIYEE
jgi:hypothetical protein